MQTVSRWVRGIMGVGLLWAAPMAQTAPWAVMVDSPHAQISTLDFGAIPPTVYGPFLSGQLGSAGGGLFDVVVTPDGQNALVSNFGDSAIYRISLANPTNPVATGCISNGFFAEDIAIAPNGRYALVTDGGFSTNVAIIDLTTASFSTSITYAITSGYAQAVSISPDSQTAVFCDYWAGKIIAGVVDPARGLISETALSCGNTGRPVNVAISPDGVTVLVADAATNEVYVFKIVSPGVIVTGDTPVVRGLLTNQAMQSIAFSPAGDRAYVLQNGGGTNNTLAWLQVNGPGNVTVGGTNVAKLISQGQSQLFGVDTLAVSVDGVWALAGNPTLSGSTNVLARVNLSTFAVTPMNVSTQFPVGVAFVPTPIYAFAADFDGDGLADPAIYDSRTGTWTAMMSLQNYARQSVSNFLGGPSYVPAVADYDGDRLSDPTVYQLGTGSWRAKFSGNNYTQLDAAGFLGGLGWSPTVADYDGDRKGDGGVYQETTGNWKIKRSSLDYAELALTAFWGQSGYTAVSADYDGDGLADPCVYNRTAGAWTMLMSSRNYAPQMFAPILGGTGWSPVPADYDGDGIADPAVRNDATGTWKVMRSRYNYAIIEATLGL